MDELSKRERINKNRRIRTAQRKADGLCRNCNNLICSKSSVFCEYHHKEHLEKCKKWAIENPMERWFIRLGRRSGGRKIPVEITLEDFKLWYQQEPKVCCYCGIDEKLLATQCDKKKRKLTLDRMNNDLPYRVDNICLACFRCNNMKSDFFTYPQWKIIADKLIKPRLAQFHRMRPEDSVKFPRSAAKQNQQLKGIT